MLLRFTDDDIYTLTRIVTRRRNTSTPSGGILQVYSNVPCKSRGSEGDFEEPADRSDQEPADRSDQEPGDRSDQEPGDRSDQEPGDRSDQEAGPVRGLY